MIETDWSSFVRRNRPEHFLHHVIEDNGLSHSKWREPAQGRPTGLQRKWPYQGGWGSFFSYWKSSYNSQDSILGASGNSDEAKRVNHGLTLFRGNGNFVPSSERENPVWDCRATVPQFEDNQYPSLADLKEITPHHDTRADEVRPRLQVKWISSLPLLRFGFPVVLLPSVLFLFPKQRLLKNSASGVLLRRKAWSVIREA